MSETPAPDTTRGMLLAAEAAASSRLDGETIVIGGPITVGPPVSGEDTAGGDGDESTQIPAEIARRRINHASMIDLANVRAELAEVTRECDQARGTSDIVVTAMAYVHADPDIDDVEQYWHELKAAVEHYEAIARRREADHG